MGDIILLALVAGIENSREGGGGRGQGLGMMLSLSFRAQSEYYSFMLSDSLEILTVESK